MKTEAKPGRYTVNIRGEGRAAAREPKKVPFDVPSPSSPHMKCEAKATFQLQPGSRVELRFDCTQD
jgi:hypothetical protein